MRTTLLQVGPVLVAALFLIALIRIGRLRRDKIGMVPPVGRWVLWIALFAAYLALFEWISIRAGLTAREVHPWHLGALATAIRIVGIVILAPFAEETLFRGVLQSELRDRMAAWPAILIQAAVFTALHALSLVGSSTVAFDIAQLLFEGTIYGWVRHTTRSLYPSMAMHAMGNAVAVLERLLL